MPAHAPGRHRPKSDPAGAPSAKPSHNGAPRASPTRRSRSQREAVAAPPTTTAGSTAAEVTTFASGSGPAEQRAVSLALHPGVSLGPFRLGMGVTEAIELVAAEYHMFAQGQIVYDAKHAVPSDILVQMPGLGVCLRFEQVVQQLRRIDFWPSEFLTVTYKARVVGSPTFPLVASSEHLSLSAMTTNAGISLAGSFHQTHHAHTHTHTHSLSHAHIRTHR